MVIDHLVQLETVGADIIDMVDIFDIVADLIVNHSSRLNKTKKIMSK